MPVPKPIKNEPQGKFISRCISEIARVDPNTPAEQRTAICYTSWRQSKKKEEETSNPNFGTNTVIAGRYEEFPELPEGTEKPKTILEQMEDELKLP